MSIHKSLKMGAGMGRTRNVYTRYERLLKLKEDGRWNDDSSSVYGMPKVRATVIKIGKKKKKKGPEEEK